jgi:hypothetical protein
MTDLPPLKGLLHWSPYLQHRKFFTEKPFLKQNESFFHIKQTKLLHSRDKRSKRKKASWNGRHYLLWGGISVTAKWGLSNQSTAIW